MRLIAEHDSSIPFFLNYDLHIAHEPIELPRTYFDRQQALVNASGVADYVHRRTTYQGMVSFMDEIVGNITAALHTKQMYDDTIIVYSSDNGGPSWTASHHLAASNWPLRGSKNTDLEGGVRVGAFVSGGFMQTRAQANIGRSLSGIIHIADWYSTLCALAGVSPEDARAAMAGLPSVDSINIPASGKTRPAPACSSRARRTSRGDLSCLLGMCRSHAGGARSIRTQVQGQVRNSAPTARHATIRCTAGPPVAFLMSSRMLKRESTSPVTQTTHRR